MSNGAIRSAKASREPDYLFSSPQAREDICDDLLIHMECGNMSANILLRSISKHGKFSLVGAHDEAILINDVQAHCRVLEEILQIPPVWMKELTSFGLFVHGAPLRGSPIKDIW